MELEDSWILFAKFWETVTVGLDKAKFFKNEGDKRHSVWHPQTNEKMNLLHQTLPNEWCKCQHYKTEWAKPRLRCKRNRQQSKWQTYR